MRRIVRITAIVVVSILAVALIAPSLMSGTVSDIVRREAGSLLKARLEFGDLDISLLRHFPNASVEITDLNVVGEAPFEGDTVVSAERISAVVNLLSLFSDEGFEVTKVLLDAPRVSAHKLPDGAVNWDIVRSADEEEPVADESVPEGEETPFRLRIEEFRISDAALAYRDDSTRMSFTTSPFALRLRGDMSAERSELYLRLTAASMDWVSGGVPLMSDVNLDLKAGIAADFKERRFTFNENTLMMNAVELHLDGWAAMTDRGWDMDVKAGCERVMFKDLLSLLPAFYTREFNDLSASGELSLAFMARGEMYGRRLPAFELSAGIRDGNFRYSSLPRAVSDIQLDFKASNPGGVMDSTVVDLKRFSLRMGDNALAVSAYATNLATDPYLRFATDGRLDLGMIGEVYPLEEGARLGGVITADVRLAGSLSAIDKGAYDRIDGEGHLVIEEMDAFLPSLPRLHIRRAAAGITPAAMTLGEFDFAMGRSDIAANGRLEGYLGYLLRGDCLSGRLFVKSQLLDLNEVMKTAPETPVGEESPVAGEQTPAVEEAAAPMHAIAVPRNLDLSLNVDMGRIRLGKMEIADLKGDVAVKDGRVALDGLSMRLFDGSATASGSYSTAADPARLELKLALRFTDASFAKTFEQLEVVRKMVPVFAKTGGNYSMGMELTAALDHEMSPDVMSINAAGGIRSKNIRLQNLEVFDRLAETFNNDRLRRIEARDVAIDFAIRNGRVYTEPFDLKMAGVNLNLSGSTGLDQSIDYVAKVKLDKGTSGGILESVNVRIGGTFSSPKITLGVKDAVKEGVQNAVSQQIDKIFGDKLPARDGAQRVEEARAAGARLIESARAQSARLVAEAAKKGKLAELAARKAGEKLVAEAERQAQKMVDRAEAGAEPQPEEPAVAPQQ